MIRAAAGNIMGAPKDVRPPVVLKLTIDYLRECLIDQDRIPPGESFYEYQDQRYGKKDCSRST